MCGGISGAVLSAGTFAFFLGGCGFITPLCGRIKGAVVSSPLVLIAKTLSIEKSAPRCLLSRALAFLEQTAGSFQRWTANAEIGKTCLRHFRLRENIASVQHN